MQTSKAATPNGLPVNAWRLPCLIALVFLVLAWLFGSASLMGAETAVPESVPPASIGVSDSTVADAAMRVAVGKVRFLLEQGADVDAAQGDGMTGLHWAAKKANPE